MFFTELLLMLAIARKPDGLVIPTTEEMLSFNGDVDSFITWLLEHNPERKDEIIEEYEKRRKLLDHEE